MSKDQLSWGVIGAGDVFENKSGPSIAKASRSQLTALMRRDEGELARVAGVFDVKETTTDAKALAARDDIDIVYVATPPSSHFENLKIAADAGKHILLEKPMSLNARDSQAMVEYCEKAGVQLFVSYYRRFWPHAVKMAELIKEGKIGTPIQATIEHAIPWKAGMEGWRIKPEINGGGYFVDNGAHRTDVWVALFGGVDTGSAVVEDHKDYPGVEETMTGWVRFNSGVQGLLRCDYRSGRFTDAFEIIGTEGSIKTPVFDSHVFTLTRGDQSETIDCSAERYPAPHLGLIEHIERVLLDGEKNAVSGKEGVESDKIMDAIFKR